PSEGGTSIKSAPCANDDGGPTASSDGRASSSRRTGACCTSAMVSTGSHWSSPNLAASVPAGSLPVRCLSASSSSESSRGFASPGTRTQYLLMTCSWLAPSTFYQRSSGR